MFKKSLLILLLIVISVSFTSNAVFASTGYVPSDDEIMPVDDEKTKPYAFSDINVKIFQPYLNEMDGVTSEMALPEGIISDAQCPVAPIKTLQNRYGALIKTTRTYNEPISLNDIRSLGPNQIIIFSGHGTWINDAIHSTILTGRLFDEEAYKSDPLYRQDVDEGRIINDVGNEAITYRYIEKYCPNLENSFVFLGICQGAYDRSDGETPDYDTTLVNTFIEKGASAVFAYSETTNMRYADLMLYTIIKELGEGKTLNTALSNAKDIYGQNDHSPAESKPLVFYKTPETDYSIDSMINKVSPVSNNYVFDGLEKVGVLSGVGYTLTDVIKATNVGVYSATATLNEGYTWPDGSTDPKNIEWSISKAEYCEESKQDYINSLMPNNIEIKYDGNAHNLMAIRNPKFGKYYFKLSEEASYSVDIPKATNVGTYSIDWYFDGEENAKDIGTPETPITYQTKINKGIRPNMEARIDDYYYGKELPMPYLSMDIEEGTKVDYYYFKLDDLGNEYEWKNMTSTTLEIGKYYIFAKIEESDNYEACETFDSEFEVLEYKTNPSKPDAGYKVPNTGISEYFK